MDRIVIISEYGRFSGAPTAKLACDLFDHLKSSSRFWVVHYCLPFRYHPGGLKPKRIFNLLACHFLFPMLLIMEKIRCLYLKQGCSVLVLTSPPLIQWTIGIWASILRLPTSLWFQDAHPEIEARFVEKLKLGVIAKFLRGFDRMILAQFKAAAALDEAMAAILIRERRFQGTVAVVPPWSTFLRPAQRLRIPLAQFKLRLLYAGNYGKAHDLRPLTRKIAAEPAEVQARLHFTFIGMDTAGQKQISRIFENLHCELHFLRRAERVEELSEIMRSHDFGIVSLADGLAGVACPSKAFTYLSQGLPLLYVGPKAGLAWDLCRRRWGITLDEFSCALTDYAWIKPNEGKVFHDPKFDSIQGIEGILLVDLAHSM